MLLTPCTDWFVTFTHLAGGDTRRALAITPVNLVVQLPLLLWLFVGQAFLEIFAIDRVAIVFGTLIAAPMAAAYLTERAVETRPERRVWIARLAWLPVPLLSLVVLLIAASQVQLVAGVWPILAQMTGVFVMYLAAAVAIGWGAARLIGLQPASARTLVFSLGTRNSFVVLPFALALPSSWDIAVVVIVLQSLVELWGMVGYLWLVPRYLLPSKA